MSRQYPIHVVDSDEDPSEHDYDSDATSVYANQPTVPTPTPNAAPGVDETWNMFAERTGEPSPRKTTKRIVRDFPTGPSVPHDKAPTESTKLPEEPPLKKPKVSHLEWMPPLLKHWRMLEGIPSTYEIGETSQPPPSLPLTGEPIELTVPTLVAVIHTLFRKLTDPREDVIELQSDTSRLDGDMTSTYERLDFVETHLMVNLQTAHATRARVETLEERARVTEIVDGISLVVTGMMEVVGMYLS